MADFYVPDKFKGWTVGELIDFTNKNLSGDISNLDLSLSDASWLGREVLNFLFVSKMTNFENGLVETGPKSNMQHTYLSMLILTLQENKKLRQEVNKLQKALSDLEK